jgi:hypothetical protein
VGPDVNQNQLPTDSRFFDKPFQADKIIAELQAMIAA